MYLAGGAPPDLLAPLQIGWPCRKSGEEHLGAALTVLHAGARWSLISYTVITVPYTRSSEVASLILSRRTEL